MQMKRLLIAVVMGAALLALTACTTPTVARYDAGDPVKKEVVTVPVARSVATSDGVATARGMGTAPYSLFGPGADEKDKAYRAAQISAVERYFAEAGKSESENFEAILPKVEENLDKFLLSTTIINEQNDESTRKYVVSVRVEINVSKLRNAVRGSSVITKTTQSERSSLVYVFMGREASQQRSFDARVVKHAEAEGERQLERSAAIKGTESEKIRGGTVATTASKEGRASANYRRSATVESGGSTTLRADDTHYRLLPITNYKTAITSVFSQGGFQVADPAEVLDDREIKAVEQDFSSGNDLSPTTSRSIFAALRKAQVPYLVQATLDVGIPQQDDATGLRRVAVTVTGLVRDVSGRLSREVASVPAMQYVGLGQNNAEARDKALRDAALAAAREVVSRLNAAGIY
jgi:hypothetical protein